MRYLLGGLIGLLCVAAGAAQETYRIRLRLEPDVGKSIDVKEESGQEVDQRILDEKGKELKKNQAKQVHREEYTHTVLKSDKGKPVKYRRVYRKASISDDKQNFSLPHEGKKVLFEKTKTGWEVNSEDRKGLPAGTIKELSKHAGQSIVDSITPLLPDRAVKVGESWSVSGKQAQAIAPDAPIDTKRSKGSGKLIKVYRKGKRLFGVLVFKAELVLMVPGAGSEMKIAMEGTADAIIDGSDTEGSYTTNLTITGKMVDEKDGKKITRGGTTKGYHKAAVSSQK
jgi:hypothetical protein